MPPYVLTRSEAGKDRLYPVPKEQRAQVRQCAPPNIAATSGPAPCWSKRHPHLLALADQMAEQRLLAWPRQRSRPMPDLNSSNIIRNGCWKPSAGASLIRLEIIGQADEKEFFELCFKEKILDALAEEMPTHAQERGSAPVVCPGGQSQSEAALGKLLSGFRAGGAVRRAACGFAAGNRLQTFEIRRPSKSCWSAAASTTRTSTSGPRPATRTFLRKFVKDVPAADWTGLVQRSRCSRSSSGMAFSIRRAFLWATAVICLCRTTRRMKARW